MNRDWIRDSILEIVERADRCKESAHTDFSRGRLAAFCEVLSILQTDLVGEKGFEDVLDFDIDKRYIG